jgi:hypothetical protein
MGERKGDSCLRDLRRPKCRQGLRRRSVGELAALCQRSIYRQVAAKSKAPKKGVGLQRFDPIGRMVGGTGIEPVTPTMST